MYFLFTVLLHAHWLIEALISKLYLVGWLVLGVHGPLQVVHTNFANFCLHGYGLNKNKHA